MMMMTWQLSSEFYCVIGTILRLFPCSTSFFSQYDEIVISILLILQMQSLLKIH